MKSQSGGGLLYSFFDLQSGERIDEVRLSPDDIRKTALRNFSEGSGPQWSDPGYHSDENGRDVKAGIKVIVSDIADGKVLREFTMPAVALHDGTDYSKILAHLIFGRENNEGADGHVLVDKSAHGNYRFEHVGGARRVRLR
ncbi:MAG: hypothetical protein AAB353_00705 [Candidatus Hydrogenedentota bacterium]